MPLWPSKLKILLVVSAFERPKFEMEKIMSATETEKKEDLKVTVEGSSCSNKSAEEKAAEAKANTCSTDAAAKSKEEKKGGCCG
ncbi:hypothetical protein BH11CYA1_BH11CYA1_05090 [soil metagenome]